MLSEHLDFLWFFWDYDPQIPQPVSRKGVYKRRHYVHTFASMDGFFVQKFDRKKSMYMFYVLARK